MERLQWYMRSGVSMDEMADSVQGMVAIGRYTMEQLILADTSGDDKPPPAIGPLTLDTISAEELQSKDIPPIRFIVDKLLPVGLNILASPPKYGKSWMVLDLCIASASGGRFLGYATNKCECLYLALEDSQFRLKSRMEKLLAQKKAPAGFHFAVTAHDMDNGLFDQLEAFLQDRPNVGLVVIDTLQKVRGPSKAGRGPMRPTTARQGR